MAEDSPKQRSALIGKDRAGDLAVNGVLPFLHAMASAYPKSSFGAADSFLGLYQRFGKLQHNELLREMAAQLLGQPWPEVDRRDLVNNARRQQGLLHLHHLLIGAG